jgi:hypothetical protein
LDQLPLLDLQFCLCGKLIEDLTKVIGGVPDTRPEVVHATSLISNPVTGCQLYKASKPATHPKITSIAPRHNKNPTRKTKNNAINLTQPG